MLTCSKNAVNCSANRKNLYITNRRFTEDLIGAAILYTLHVVQLGSYAKRTNPIELAASK